MPLTPGPRLGPYEITAQIGAGGMGDVYKATDTRLGRTVAIKVSRDEFSERFDREARAVAALNHPNICQLYDVGPNYLVMEFVDGRPIQSEGDRTRLLDVATQVVDALAAAHAAGIVHRDLKPDNILVTRDGRVKVLDFGLATGGTGVTELISTQAVTAAGTAVGTVAYMSPEQARGEAVDTRSDLWSLGVVLYELATGQRPFDGPTAAVVFNAILNQAPQPLAGRRVPLGWPSIVTKLLAKDRTQRYQSASDVRVDLLRRTEPPARQVTPEQASIAVLPFANLSRNEDDEYFSDGLAEEIINALVRVPGLRVIARTSAFAFKGQNIDVRKIAEALGVTTVLEGSVRRAGARIRVAAQLVTAQDGSHLWSERYDRQMEDVFAIQDEIAGAIAGALRARLTTAPVRRYTPPLPAYEAFLKARSHRFQLIPGALSRARTLYEQAIAEDPGYALAHSELGLLYLSIAMNNSMPALEAMPLGRQAAARALEIEPDLPEAHAMLGVVAATHDYDWAAAEQHFRVALAADPVPPEVRHLYGFFFLAALGRAEEGVEQQRLALEDDPLNVLFHIGLAGCLTWAGRYEESAAACRRTQELQENIPYALYFLAQGLAAQGRLEEALPHAEQYYRVGSFQGFSAGTYAGILFAMGDEARAQAVLEEFERKGVPGVPEARVTFHLLRGDAEGAIDWLARAAAERHPSVVLHLAHPGASRLRSSPRWPEVASLLNLPAAGAARPG